MNTLGTQENETAVITTPQFWDCECSENYIHHKMTDKRCDSCGFTHDESPDSRPDEVKLFYADRNEPLPLGTFVTVQITQYDHKRGSTPYQCALTGRITRQSRDGKERSYCVEGSAHTRLGPSGRWGWYKESNITVTGE